jgi:integrase
MSRLIDQLFDLARARHAGGIPIQPTLDKVCKFRLFPVGQVRKLRFHHRRHATASLLLMQGADPAAVQRIMRHQDPRITTEVYGHRSRRCPPIT